MHRNSPMILLFASLATLGVAQFPPVQEGIKTIKSRFHENVTISFKEPGLCETTAGVKSYAGYIGMPSGYFDDVLGKKITYPLNTFFWFFAARHDPHNAPLAIWLNGGPGGSSILGLLQENGPCFVNNDSRSTVYNHWSWNNHVNMIYIDQPNQVGFSYDIPTNVTIYTKLDQDTEIVPTNFSQVIHPQVNLTTQVGTISTQKPAHTVNSTEQAAHALWHFAQVFFTEFPHYKPANDLVSLWTESYGGHYGPGFLRFFQQQNERILNGTLDEHAHFLHLDTLGIVNGYFDAVIQEEANIIFPYNNTYGIQIFNETVFGELMHNFTRPGGCRDQIIQCQKELAGLDKNTVNAASELPDHLCRGLDELCFESAEKVFKDADYARFDITNPKHVPFPPSYLHGYLTNENVLGAIGSPVNFTWGSDLVDRTFLSTLDEVHGGFLDAVGYLLDSGVKVHLMNGDRDFACNWISGEMSSLAVPYSRIKDFRDAGYAELVTAAKGIGGLTRQFGNFSFTRVFQSGHEVPAHQPEAAYAIFMRAMFNYDIPTGQVCVHDEFATMGPASTWHVKQAPPERPKPECYVLIPQTCTPEVWERVVAGNVTVRDFVVVEDEEDEEAGRDDSDEL